MNMCNVMSFVFYIFQFFYILSIQNQLTGSMTSSQRFNPLVTLIKDQSYVSPTQIQIGLMGQKIFTCDNCLKTVYFCPTENPRTAEANGKSNNRYINYCLFENNQASEDGCRHEPKPLIMPMQRTDFSLPEGITLKKNCGAEERGKMYGVFFVLCKSQTEMELQLIYKFCYDHPNEKTIYTWHSISSPLLLQNVEKLENLAIYESNTLSTYGYDRFGDDFVIIAEQYSNEHKDQTGEPAFVFHKMVPSEDFVFGVWKQATYHMVNANQMPIGVSSLWYFIDDQIRKKAIQTETNYHVFMTASSSRDNTLWMKIVYDTHSKKGVTVIVFQSEIRESKFCKEDLSICNFQFWQGSKYVETKWAYCCPITYERFFQTKFAVESTLSLN